MKKILIFLTYLWLFSMKTLDAQIEKVTVSWDAIRCTKTCQDLLTKQFHTIPGVAQIVMNPAAGHTELTWKPNASFSYAQINAAMRIVGIPLKEIRIKVHGYLQHSEQHVILISSGDSTHFDLLNPMTSKIDRTLQYSLAARALSPELRNELLEAEKKKQLVTIEGALFRPDRNYSPAELVVEHINYGTAKE